MGSRLRGNDGGYEMISFFVLLGIVVCFSAILALALNFQWGLGGMVNFGLTGFYALGAYSSALLMLKAGGQHVLRHAGRDPHRRAGVRPGGARHAACRREGLLRHRHAGCRRNAAPRG